MNPKDLWNSSLIFQEGLKDHFLYSDCYIDNGEGIEMVAISPHDAQQNKIWDFCTFQDVVAEFRNRGWIFNSNSTPVTSWVKKRKN